MAGSRKPTQKKAGSRRPSASSKWSAAYRETRRQKRQQKRQQKEEEKKRQQEQKRRQKEAKKEEKKKRKQERQRAKKRRQRASLSPEEVAALNERKRQHMRQLRASRSQEEYERDLRYQCRNQCRTRESERGRKKIQQSERRRRRDRQVERERLRRFLLQTRRSLGQTQLEPRQRPPWHERTDDDICDDILLRLHNAAGSLMVANSLRLAHLPPGPARQVCIADCGEDLARNVHVTLMDNARCVRDYAEHDLPTMRVCGACGLRCPMTKYEALELDSIKEGYFD